jgi:hypothetical protein
MGLPKFVVALSAEELPGESGIHPDIHLVRPGGIRDRLGYDAWDEGLICIWAHEPHEPRRVYDAIEIRTDRPLAIREVRWWSGQRTAWP